MIKPERINILRFDYENKNEFGASFENQFWQSIKNFENIYEVNTSGEIRSLNRVIMVNGKERLVQGRILKPKLGHNGYYSVTLCNGGHKLAKYVHRIVAEAFINKPEGKDFVNHINGNKLDNRIENLEWVSHSENVKYAYKIGLTHVSNHRRLIDKYTGKEFASIKEASLFYSLNYSTCRGYLRGNRRNKTPLRYKED